MKAIVLAAGLGERLRPLTRHLPKPLTPVLGTTCLGATLSWLAAAGHDSIGINTHWLPGRLHEALGDGAAWGVRLHWQHEPELLDGMGTLKSFTDFLGDETALLINADIVHDLDLDAAVAAHRASGAAMTLVCADLVGPLRHPVVWDAGGRLTGIRRSGLDHPRGYRIGEFTGLHLIEPVIWRDHVPRGRSYHLSRDLCPHLLAAGVPVHCQATGRLWADIGSRAGLDRAIARLLAAPPPSRYLGTGREVARGVWVEPGGVADGELRPPVFIAAGATAEAGSVLGPCAALVAGATLAAGERLAYGVRLPAELGG